MVSATPSSARSARRLGAELADRGTPRNGRGGPGVTGTMSRVAAAVFLVLAACGGGSPSTASPPLVNAGPPAEPPIALADLSDCAVDDGYQLDRHVASNGNGDPELHVVGIYEAPTRPGFRATHEGTARVTVRRSGRPVLSASPSSSLLNSMRR